MTTWQGCAADRAFGACGRARVVAPRRRRGLVIRTRSPRPVRRRLREAAGAAGRAAPAESGDEPSGVLRAFVRDGRLLRIPVARSKRLVVLEVLAQEFEPGQRYSEAAVNLIWVAGDADTRALRRYLVDEAFSDRSSGVLAHAGAHVTV